MRTICKSCIFAKFNNGQQYGCYLGRLDKFFDLGKVVPIQPEDTFYTINTVCNTCRTTDKPIQIGEAIRKVKKQIVPVIHCFVKIDDACPLSKVEETVHSLTRQIVKPKITLLITQEYPLYKLHNYLLENNSLYINQVFHSSLDEEVRAQAKISNSSYISICEPGYIYSKLCFAKLHGRINVQLQSIVLVKNPFIISTSLYNFLSEDKLLNKEELTKLVEERDNAPSLIRSAL